ncbi:C7orf25-like protein [Nymphaea thermarum]|nr:C7orf25-like protein [Nymphaea thermarum]
MEEGGSGWCCSAVSVASEVEHAKERCRRVIHKINGLPLSRIAQSCKATLLKSAKTELNFLSRLSPFSTRIWNPVWIIVSDRNPKYVSWHDSHRQKGLKARIQLVLETTLSASTLRPDSIIFFFAKGLSEIASQGLVKNFKATNISSKFIVSEDDIFEELEGDWVKITQKVQTLTELVADSSRSHQGALAFQIRVNDIKDNDDEGEDDQLSYMNAEADATNSPGDIVAVSDSPFHLLLSAIRCNSTGLDRLDNFFEERLINFDTTALVAIVTGTSNGCTEQLLKASESEMRRRFKSNYNFVLAQVKSECENPIIEELRALVCDKRPIICKTVCSEFKALVSLCGGPNEKVRADCLLKYLLVVPDNPSARIVGLPTTRKLSLKNKIIFGTGDYWHAPTLTANMAFVRAISQTGMSLLTFEHRPCALVGD